MGRSLRALVAAAGLCEGCRCWHRARLLCYKISMAKMFEPGMTLGPGESAFLDAELLLPPELVELSRRGVVSIEVKQGRPKEYKPGSYRNRCTVMVNGKPYATFDLLFDAKPHPTAAPGIAVRCK